MKISRKKRERQKGEHSRREREKERTGNERKERKMRRVKNSKILPIYIQMLLKIWVSCEYLCDWFWHCKASCLHYNVIQCCFFGKQLVYSLFEFSTACER